MYTVHVKQFRAKEKGMMVGELDIYIPELGWAINFCQLLQKEDRMWVRVPQKYLKDAPDDKKFLDVITFEAADPKKKYEFSDKCVKAYREWSKSCKESPSCTQEEIPF